MRGARGSKAHASSPCREHPRHQPDRAGGAGLGPVSLGRMDTDVVVTEHGAADLRGSRFTMPARELSYPSRPSRIVTRWRATGRSCPQTSSEKVECPRSYYLLRDHRLDPHAVDVAAPAGDRRRDCRIGARRCRGGRGDRPSSRAHAQDGGLISRPKHSSRSSERSSRLRTS